jgi:hypothetical protein
MAIRYEDECCGCAVPSYPCSGDACPNRNVPHLYCDNCKEEADELYETENGQLCAECVLGMFEKVRID